MDKKSFIRLTGVESVDGKFSPIYICKDDIEAVYYHSSSIPSQRGTTVQCYTTFYVVRESIKEVMGKINE